MMYEPEVMDAIEAQHKDGRLMPFIEFPLAGGERVLRVLRLIRQGDKYVCEITAEEATDLLRSSNLLEAK